MNLNFLNIPEIFYRSARQKHIYLKNNYAWPYEKNQRNKKYAITLNTGDGGDLPESFLSENYCTDWMWSSEGKITGLSSYTPTKPASTFTHWDLNGTDITYSEYAISDDTIVTAVWEDLSYEAESTLTLEGASITIFYAMSDSNTDEYNKNSTPKYVEFLKGTNTTTNIIKSDYRHSYTVIVIPASFLTEMNR